jgi:hypothetical protein
MEEGKVPKKVNKKLNYNKRDVNVKKEKTKKMSDKKLYANKN